MTNKIRKHLTRVIKTGLFILVLCLLNSGCKLIFAEKAIDEKTVDEIIVKAKPLIEEITGRKFKSDIEYKILNRSEFQKIFTEELNNSLREWEKELGEDLTKRRTEMNARKRSQFYIGRYLKKKKVIYIVQDNIRPIKELYEIKDEDMDDFLFMIIAHEMVHNLDDQYYNLVKLLGEGKNIEDTYARGAVVGGSAAYITEIIADRLNISKRIYKTSLMIDVCMKDESNPSSKEVYDLYYTEGKEFIRTILSEKGDSEYGTSFMSPPVSTRQIYHPEEYLKSAVKDDIDCSELLSKIMPALPKKEGMRSQTTALGTMILRGTLMSEGISKEDASLVADKCLNGVSYTSFQHTINPALFKVDILNFENSETAAKFDEIMRLIQNSKDNQLKAKLNTSYKLLKKENRKMKGFDFVVFRNVETEENGKTNNSKETVGVMKNFHISIKYLNMNESTEQDMMDILKMIYAEQLILKQNIKSTSL